MDTKQVVAMLKALADPTRLKIIALLQTRSCCVCELVPIFGISQPAISKHMSRLKSVDLVIESRKGQWVFYTLNKARLEQVAHALGNLPDYSEEFSKLEQQGLLVTCE
ncbi:MULTISPECIES: ArsR/SmtB family transcription factor [Brevibacillus]|jgi:Predicted transcriptional regulators|nr:metalloregulator ArsR/SmtB family transcription factor [Brevibacillus borstelensis]KKX55026.1 transcriptional regulator [Brevibacillus borstelensis cifa_chp40]MBE5393836.1 winged helix-turn-helix transcriptional regulator [Brevibacillus borstelensis]MCC0566712.1 metalloregulator ArsR/SmtB family transcription factor [Brevibacillus borstelensis]MCM3473154.1 metalloregulator ArsR/SmtB family transcription factor [Brevibacillus borstelensis]MCM3561273.1 metalloregulator ArsR/SmtB family transc